MGKIFCNKILTKKSLVTTKNITAQTCKVNNKRNKKVIKNRKL